MRVIFLNSWFGKVGKPFFDFLENESSKTDIFCFMEVSPELFNRLSLTLKSFRGIFNEGLFLRAIGMTCGQVVFINNKFDLLSNGKVDIYRQLKNDIGFMQHLELKNGNKKLWIGSVHGKSRPGQKMDSPARIKQSKILIDFFKDKEGPKIIGGDFNLNPDTRSVKMFEEEGYKNLIRDYKIDNTRNKLSWKEFNNVQHFADYVFVSDDVKVNKFEVPYMEISDHLPLILDFEV